MDAWKQRQAIQLGQNIRERRKALGLSQSELAAGLFSTQSVSLIERGKLNVTPETLAAFAERLQCQIDDLLHIHDDLQEELLEQLLQTARQYQEKNQQGEALESYHSLYTEALAKNSGLYLRESTHQLCLLYHRTGEYTVSNEWGRKALELLDPAQHLDLTITTYSTMGQNHYWLGKIWEAYDIFRAAEKLIDQYKYPGEQAGQILYSIASMSQMLRNWEGCIWYCERALKIFEEYDSIIKIGNTHMMLGTSYANQKLYDKGRMHYERSIRILSQTSDLVSLARAYQNLSALERDMDRIESSRKNALKSLKLKRQAKDVNTIPLTLRALAQLAMREQNYEEARQYLHEALNASEQLKHSLQLAQTLKLKGELMLEEGNEEEFVALYQRAIEYFEKLDFSTDLAASAEKLGEFYASKGKNDLAIPYLLKATEHYRKLLTKS